MFRIPSLPSWGGSSSSNSSRAPSLSEAGQAAGDLEQGETAEEEKERKQVEHNTPKLSVWFSLMLLVVVTVITGGELSSAQLGSVCVAAEQRADSPSPVESHAVTAEFLVSSIDGLTQTGAVSREFTALILLPLVGNVSLRASKLGFTAPSNVSRFAGRRACYGRHRRYQGQVGPVERGGRWIEYPNLALCDPLPRLAGECLF